MSQIIIHMYIFTYLMINFRNFIDDVGSEIDKTRQKFGIMNAQRTELPPGEFSVLYDSCIVNLLTIKSCSVTWLLNFSFLCSFFFCSPL